MCFSYQKTIALFHIVGYMTYLGQKYILTQVCFEAWNIVYLSCRVQFGAVAERLRHRSREQGVPISSPACTSVLR